MHDKFPLFQLNKYWASNNDYFQNQIVSLIPNHSANTNKPISKIIGIIGNKVINAANATMPPTELLIDGLFG